MQTCIAALFVWFRHIGNNKGSKVTWSQKPEFSSQNALHEALHTCFKEATSVAPTFLASNVNKEAFIIMDLLHPNMKTCWPWNLKEYPGALLAVLKKLCHTRKGAFPSHLKAALSGPELFIIMCALHWQMASPMCSAENVTLWGPRGAGQTRGLSAKGPT